MGYFSPLNPLSFAWMSSPNAVTAVLPAIGPDTSLDQFDRCIAYLLDIEARAERFKREYPKVRTHDVRLEQLNEINFVEDLFARLGITPTGATRKLCGLTSNERQRRKEQIANPTTIDQCQTRLAEYIRKAEAHGIKIPVSALL
jgi:tRNA(His) 5'-end guanylyltransferase